MHTDNAAIVQRFIDEALDDGGVVGMHAAPALCGKGRAIVHDRFARIVSYLAGSRPKDLSCC